MQLVIDTSTEYAGLALVENTLVLAEMTWRCGLNHTVELYPHIDALLKLSGKDMNNLNCIYVARGPGSFNGLRVGVSAAKGLALSLGIPIIAIGTLEATAYQHSETGLPVYAVQNAGREEVAAALFQKKTRKGWISLIEEHITTPAALASEVKETTIFCGDMNPPTQQLLKKLLKTKAIIPSPFARLRRPAFLAELGQIRREKQDFDNLAALQPQYLRRPPITERKKA